jgi:FlaA1/EpsC-like NDP-sugar epimerase
MKKRILIIGCGIAGKSIAKALLSDAEVEVVGFLDDKKNASYLEIPVIGKLRDLPKIVVKNDITDVIIAIPSQRGKLFRDVVLKLRDQSHVQLLIVPKSSEILQSKVLTKEDLKSLEPEDLVGEEISKDMLQEVGAKAVGKNILITGGAGSIGSELTLQLLQAGAGSVTIIDNSERNIFYLTQKIRSLEKRNRLNSHINIVLGNVQNKQLVENVILQNKINVIFHAAAFKHVFLLEDFPTEALLNNVYTTKLLIEIGHKHGVKEFMLISTDKAVKPINIMGKSKRAAELIAQYFDSIYDGMTISAVRFGNVFNSSGSAIELFLSQIAKNEEITITNPKMKRFFMSIPEAASLVLYSWTIMQKQHLYMFEMGDEVKITDLAHCLLIINHKNPSTYPFETINKKSGEKIRELLFDTEHEKIEETRRNKIHSISINTRLSESRMSKLILEIESVVKESRQKSRDKQLSDRSQKLISKFCLP